MSTHYSVEFQVDIDPQKEIILKTKMDEIGLRDNNDYWFERDEEQSRTILFIEVNDYMPYTSASNIEDFIINDLGPIARSTVLITEECEGEVNVYAIGPDKEKIQSEFHRSEAREHLRVCTTDDLKVIHEWLDDKLMP